jgi:hypothetical protein
MFFVRVAFIVFCFTTLSASKTAQRQKVIEEIDCGLLDVVSLKQTDWRQARKPSDYPVPSRGLNGANPEYKIRLTAIPTWVNLCCQIRQSLYRCPFASHEGIRGNGIVVVLVLNPRASWRWVVSITWGDL